MKLVTNLAGMVHAGFGITCRNRSIRTLAWAWNRTRRKVKDTEFSRHTTKAIRSLSQLEGRRDEVLSLREKQQNIQVEIADRRDGVCNIQLKVNLGLSLCHVKRVMDAPGLFHTTRLHFQN